MTRGKAIFLMGPTGAGKTDVALRLAEQLPVEIISVDSALIYRDMDIGTAKPSRAQRARAPHALIDIKDPTEAYSAAEFRRDALREMQRVARAGRIPLLVGGTGLYFRALERGISALPGSDPRIREGLLEKARSEGWGSLHRELQQNDPAAGARIHPNDPQRILRALEVFAITGKPMSLCWAEGRDAGDFDYTLSKIIWAPADRDGLVGHLEVRFREMLAQGLVEECENLRQKYQLCSHLPSARLVGYRQVWGYLDGQCDRTEMCQRAVIATRQLAKRQYTWFRAEAEARRFDARAAGAEPELFRYLTDFIARREL